MKIVWQSRKKYTDAYHIGNAACSHQLSAGISIVKCPFKGTVAWDVLAQFFRQTAPPGWNWKVFCGVIQVLKWLPCVQDTEDSIRKKGARNQKYLYSTEKKQWTLKKRLHSVQDTGDSLLSGILDKGVSRIPGAPDEGMMVKKRIPGVWDTMDSKLPSIPDTGVQCPVS